MPLPQEVEHWSLTTLRENLIKIGTKIVTHGRYDTFQMPEIGIPRDLFADILRRTYLSCRRSGCFLIMARHGGEGWPCRIPVSLAAQWTR